MSFMDFCFLNTDAKGINLDYVLWLEMVMSEFIGDVCHLLLETSLSILTKVYWVCLKKYWRNLVNFAILYCVLWFVTHVTKAAHFSLSSSYSIFPLLSISKWGNDISLPVLRLINFSHYFCHAKSGFPANIYVMNKW